MTLFYVDSSAWVKRYYVEPGTDWMQTLLDPLSNQRLACATLGFPEVAATLTRQQAARRVIVGQLDEIFKALEQDWQRFYRIPVDETVSNRAVALTREHRLRGADSVHLAAADHLRRRISGTTVSMAFVCADVELNAAARAIGLSVVNPVDPIN